MPVPANGAQAVDRALDLLSALADADGPVSLSELAGRVGLAAPTAHRLIRSLAGRGFVRQDRSRRYVLGPRLIVLGERANTLLAGWAAPYLARLRDLTGETVNLAVLDGDEIVYLTQAASRHQMRMFTEPGRRVLPHTTAVGKAVLATLPDGDVRALLARTGMPARTAATRTEPDELLAELDLVRRTGYAMDDGEHETGVRCIGAAVSASPSPMAVSVSGPSARVRNDVLEHFATEVLRTAGQLRDALASR